ncbi:MAG TPA: S8 family serine peptidase [Verrucomicrobiae bacterium]|jgi:hypothetical protein
MRRERPLITGTGIRVAQPEGIGFEGPTAWQASPLLNHTVFFTWTSSQGTATNFPNSVGVESSHADGVGTQFYSFSAGVSPGVPRVDCYEAEYFIESIVTPKTPIAGQVVNQSFILNLADTPAVDGLYDAYAAMYNVLFVSGMNNLSDTPHSPGSCRNGIGVGRWATNVVSSVGPTLDGRAKPDIVAPNPYATSFATPLVSGAAALLLQAGAANDGGANTAFLATNSTVIKALLLNGAVKMTNWTNGFRRPLDARFGAGVLNVYNSDLQLRGGRRQAIATNNVAASGPHPPANDTNNVASLRGWDFSEIENAPLNDRVAHYYFNLPTNSGAFSAAATLVWKKGTGALVNLELFLYETSSNRLVTCSTSSVDNVEHIFVPKLPAGRYDLQVLKRSTLPAGAEDYALAFDFTPVQLSIARSDTNVVVSWPASPAGFVLQTAADFDAPVSWQNVSTDSVLSNAMNTVTCPATTSMQYYRLFRP